MIRNKKYWKGLANYFSGELNKTDENLFFEKVTNNKQLNQDFELMKKAWYSADKIKSGESFDSKKAWQNLKNKLEEDGILQENSKEVIRADFRHSIRIAATVLILLAIGIPVIYLTVRELSSSNTYFEQVTSDRQETFELPDGSRIYLNEGAKIRYNNNYEEQREVRLEGEGYFEVMADPDKPFHVKTGKVLVTVLGTAFNVKEAADESVEVFVASGKVEVLHIDSEKTLTLEPGQLAKAGDNLSISTLNDLNYLSWKTKEFQFIDKPLSEIILILEGAYHVQVDSKNIPVSDMSLTTTYKGQTFEAILNTICTAFNINYQKEGKVYILQRK